jgi:hypothetical protein
VVQKASRRSDAARTSASWGRCGSTQSRRHRGGALHEVRNWVGHCAKEGARGGRRGPLDGRLVARAEFRAAKAAQVQTKPGCYSSLRRTGARLQGAQACAGKEGAGESVAAVRLTLAELQAFVRGRTGAPAPQTPQRPELEGQARGSQQGAHRREGRLGTRRIFGVAGCWLSRPQPPKHRLQLPASPRAQVQRGPLPPRLPEQTMSAIDAVDASASQKPTLSASNRGRGRENRRRGRGQRGRGRVLSPDTS